MVQTMNRFPQTMVVLVSFLATSGHATGQAQPSVEAEGIYAAAQYVLAEERSSYLLPSPTRIVVDVESAFGFGRGGTPIGDDEKAAARRLAVSLGARPGRLENVTTCPVQPPTPEEFASGYWGCRFVGPTDLVLQVSNARVEGETMAVWIGVWREVTDEHGRAKYLSGYGREVLLTPEADGTWKVFDVREGGYGHI